MIDMLRWCRFGVAVWLACFLHRKQKRKILQTPYISHPLIVSGLVFEMKGSIHAATAAVLHDVFEDIGGIWIRPLVVMLFGRKIAKLINEVSQNMRLPKQQRKPQQVNNVSNNRMSFDALIIKMADLLHNSKSIRAEIQRKGPDVYTHFSGGSEKVMWYYQAMCEAYRHNEYAFEFRYRIEELEGVLTDIKKYKT